MPARAKTGRLPVAFLAGLALLTAAVVWWLRRRANESAGFDFGQSASVRPAAGQESTAQQPSGGATSIPGQLPSGLVVNAGAGLTDQVQAAEAVTVQTEAPLLTQSPSLTPTGYGFVTTPHEYGTTTVYGPGGPVVDTDYNAGPPHPTVTPTIPHPVGGGQRLGGGGQVD